MTYLAKTTGGKTILLFINNILFMAANNEQCIHVVLRDGKTVEIELPSPLCRTSETGIAVIQSLIEEGANND